MTSGILRVARTNPTSGAPPLLSSVCNRRNAPVKCSQQLNKRLCEADSHLNDLPASPALPALPAPPARPPIRAPAVLAPRVIMATWTSPSRRRKPDARRLGGSPRAHLEAPQAPGARPRPDAHQPALPASSLPTTTKYLMDDVITQAATGICCPRWRWPSACGDPRRRRHVVRRTRRCWASPRSARSPRCARTSKRTSCACRSATSIRRRPAC